MPLVMGRDLIELGFSRNPAASLETIRAAQLDGRISTPEEAFQLARRLNHLIDEIIDTRTSPIACALTLLLVGGLTPTSPGCPQHGWAEASRGRSQSGTANEYIHGQFSCKSNCIIPVRKNRRSDSATRPWLGIFSWFYPLAMLTSRTLTR